ncbi:phosphatases II, partial [Lophium mytilinum]
DKPSADISTVVARAVEIIDAVEKEGGVLLVHCSAGISRSPTVVAAYLMLQKGWTLQGALGEMRRGRGCVRPNEGFLRQLG